jgi:phage shock protein C
MNCKYHPDREAQAGCVGCGELVCQECDVLVGGRHFCRKCLAGAADSRPPVHPAAPVGPAGPAAAHKKLYRSRRDRWLAGVCGGIAEYAGMDPTLVRVLAFVIFLLTALLPFILGYIIMALVIPEEPAAER